VFFNIDNASRSPHFDGQKSVYHGKVRDVYNINDDIMVMVATDRISAFDVILPKGIPFKGQVLNQIAAKFLDATADICPNWKLATPDPMVTVGLKCEGFRVEMIIRGILTGSAWRDYKNGCREICGVKLPEGMKENQRFPEPIITPTTKADEGHDLNISKEEIIAQGIVSAEDYENLLSIVPGNYQAQLGLALLNHKSKHYTEAMDMMNHLASQFPDSAVVFAARANMEKDRKMYSVAEYDITKAINLDPENADYLMMRADLRAKLGLWPDAKADLKKLIQLGVSQASLQDLYTRVSKRKRK
jgi:hypothetical protein